MIEMIVVIGIILLLMAAIFGIAAKMRDRAKLSNAKSLIETCQNALESYRMEFRDYPPETTGAYTTGAEALAFFLTTTYRKSPSAPGESAATLNVGPFAHFTEEQVKDLNGTGRPVIVDPWYKPVIYKVTTQTDTDVWNTTKTRTKKIPMIYSSGPDRADQGGAGDDIVAGK
jgi:type II secretory pathway pseudopilin PulG